MCMFNSQRFGYVPNKLLKIRRLTDVCAFFHNHTDGIYFGNFRYATPEEINNHLISTGQIPSGEPIGVGIDPDKDGMFKYSTHNGSTFVGNCSTLTDKIPVKPKTILSIDDEELPMVNIIKTKTINLLSDE